MSIPQEQNKILPKIGVRLIQLDLSDAMSLIYLSVPNTNRYCYLTKPEFEDLIQELTELKDKMI